MDNIVSKYIISIIPYHETDETPCSQVHVEITCDLDEFTDRFSYWLNGFGAFGPAYMREEDMKPKFRIRMGQEDVSVVCDEDDIIFSIVYCCYCCENPDTVTEIVYRGNRYTDISDVCFLPGLMKQI